MKRYIILWDNDIGWSEKLRKELAKLAVELVEPFIAEGVESTANPREEILHQLSMRNKEAAAVVLSTSQLAEWDESADEVMAEGSKNLFGRKAHIYGEEVLRSICMRSISPVVLITDKGMEEQELAAFEAGVCEYMEREKAIQICVKRILACSRKGIKEENTVFDDEEMFYPDEKKQCIYFAGKEIALTPKEYLVFSVLWKNRGELVSKEELLTAVWGERPPECQRVVDTVIKQLRAKLKETVYEIQTKYKRGYYICRNSAKMVDK